MTIAPDGKIWTVGWLKSGEIVSRYNILKRFDASGKLLSTLDLAVKDNGEIPGDATQTSLLKSSEDRVGWLTNGNEYIEFGLDGRELGRFPHPPGPAPQPFETTLALSQNDEVLIGTRDGNGLKVWSLDRANRAWDAVELSGAKPTRWAILGFDGDKVVVIEESDPTMATISRYSVAVVK